MEAPAAGMYPKRPSCQRLSRPRRLASKRPRLPYTCGLRVSFRGDGSRRWLLNPRRAGRQLQPRIPAFPLRLLEGRNPPNCDVRGRDPQCPVNVNSSRPRREHGPKVLWPRIAGSAALEGRLRRCMTVLHRPSAGPMFLEVASAGISRQQSQSIPSGISASRSEPRHLQPTAVGPLTFALSVRRGLVRC